MGRADFFNFMKLYQTIMAMKSGRSLCWVFLVGFLLVTLQAGQASTPTATTGAASTITAPTATLNGLVNPNGLGTSWYFQWGTTAAYGTTTGWQPVPAVTNPLAVQFTLSGLSPAMVYHYRLGTTNSDGQAFGADQTFNTLALAPSVTTQSASSLATTSATLNGTVVPNGAIVYFQWGLTAAYGNATPQYVATGGSQAWSGPLTGLAPGTLYHYRLLAANSGGTAYGLDRTFQTTTLPPTATTTPATGVTQTSALLNGTVNPNGLTATVYFQWGPTVGYGNTTPNLTIGSGYSLDYLSQGLPGLLPNTQYYYRIVATSSAGTVMGQAQSFVTAPLLPAALTGLASAITGGAATLNGVVNPNGYATTYAFQWGLTTAYGNATAPVAAGQSDAYSAAATGISGLQPTTTYHFRVVAASQSGTSTGLDQTFTTIGPSPAVTTLAASQITGSAAVLNASGNPNGLTATGYFQWGLTSQYNNQGSALGLGSGNATLAEAQGITSLQPKATYHYNFTASSRGGIAIGADKTLTTVVQPPAVLTLPALYVLQNSAQLEGNVNPKGWPTYYYFRYGTTTNYQVVTALQGAGSGNATNLFGLPVANLSSYTLYHYQIVATNIGGVVFGNDVTFRTVAPSPQVTTGSGSDINPTATSAVLFGAVNPSNLTATNWFEWGTTTNYGSRTTPQVIQTTTTLTAPITGLAPGTLYHFRLVSSSIGGTATGNDQDFVTLTSATPMARATPLAQTTPTITLTSVAQQGNQIAFAWTGVVGQSYLVQYATNLSTSAWSDLLTVTATNAVTTVSDTISPAENRVYRVVTVPPGNP